MAGDYSINTGIKKTFSVADYVVFGLTLVISAAIGLIYAIKDRNKMKSEEYLLGGRQMHVIPVSMSLLVTFLSALTLLGTSAEMYNYSTMYWWLCASFVLAIVTSVVVFIPFFYNLEITSIFQYLEMRFNKVARTLAVILYFIPAIIYMALVLYAPALALNAVTGLDLWGCVIGVGVVVTLYTALGGMKAVLWTDTFQAAVMIAGLLAVLIEGSIVVGGFQNAWNIANNRSRILFDDFSFDPSTRHSVWSVVIGGGFVWMSLYGVNQAQVQRALSCPTIGKARIALLINLPGLILVVTLCCMIGILMIAFYADCHPLKFKNLIFSTDQLLPLFVMDILGHLPGVPGIFISCLLSGSLSTLSSGLNAFGAIVPCDFVIPFYRKKLSDRAITIISKCVVFFMGGVTIAFAFVVSKLGTILQATYAVTSTLGGPMTGMFFLGIFFPWANSWGAITGTLFSTAFMVWICIGAFVNRVYTPNSPVFTHGCNWNVTTPATTLAATTAMSATNSTPAPLLLAKSSDPFYPMYTVSYLYYSPIAITVVVIVGLFVSFITGATNPTDLDPRLICPLFDKIFPYLPECVLRPLRCGINHEGKYDKSRYETDRNDKGLEKKNEHEASEKNDFVKNPEDNAKLKYGPDNPAFTDSENPVVYQTAL